MDPQTAVLETNLATVQRDVSEIKQEQRHLTERIDKLGDKIDRVAGDLGDKIDRVASDLGGKIDRVASDVNKRIDGTRDDVFGLKASLESVKTSIEAVKGSIESSKVWMLTTLFACIAALLAVMAHGFKWI